ncbi:MAG TPA: hypothetical protein VEI97_05260 [bacterium]|nr:hypothetical protein [bacterium]
MWQYFLVGFVVAWATLSLWAWMNRQIECRDCSGKGYLKIEGCFVTCSLCEGGYLNDPRSV